MEQATRSSLSSSSTLKYMLTAATSHPELLNSLKLTLATPQVQRIAFMCFLVHAIKFSVAAWVIGRVKAFVADITRPDELLANVPEGSVDTVTMIFCLSAISPEKAWPSTVCLLPQYLSSLGLTLPLLFIMVSDESGCV